MYHVGDKEAVAVWLERVKGVGVGMGVSRCFLSSVLFAVDNLGTATSLRKVEEFLH